MKFYVYDKIRQLAKRSGLASVVLFLLLLSAAVAAQSTLTFPVTKFVVEGDNPITLSKIDVTLQQYIGNDKRFEDLKAAAQALQELLHKRGFTSYRVILPAQDLRDGIVILRVVGFRIGKINVTGNQHFSEENIRSTVPALKAGTVPDTNSLSRELLLANEHPAKALTLTFRESEEQQAIDTILTVTDERPYSFFANFHNQSSRDTPRTRLTLGVQHSNLFNHDHIFTATYTTVPDNVSRVKQYGFDYRIPVYHLAGTFSFNYTRSDTKSGRVAGDIDVSGAGEFFGVSYTHHLLRLEKYTHTISFGLEDKQFINDATFGDGQPIGKDVRSRPLSLRYTGNYSFNQGNTRFQLAYVRNLPGGVDNSDEAYSAQRIEARRNWDAWRVGMGAEYSIFETWRLRGRVEGQYSADSLIPGEQFGIGGVSSVRGYDERLLSGDSGLSGSIELWSPAIKYNLQFLGFIDAGHRRAHNRQPGENTHDNLSGAGIGLRGSWKRSAIAEAYIARALNDAGGLATNRTKIHFNFLLRY